MLSDLSCSHFSEIIRFGCLIRKCLKWIEVLLINNNNLMARWYKVKTRELAAI